MINIIIGRRSIVNIVPAARTDPAPVIYNSGPKINVVPGKRPIIVLHVNKSAAGVKVTISETEPINPEYKEIWFKI